MSGVFENTLCSTPYQGDYLATASATADALDLSQTAALIEREGLRFDGTAGAVISGGGIPAVGTGDFTLSWVSQRADVSNFILVSGLNGAMAILESSILLTVSVEGGASANFSLSTSTNIRHLCISRASGVISVYENLVLVGTSSTSLNFTQPSYVLNGNAYGISSWVGRLSRLLSFNYALTASENTALTRRGLVTLPEQRGGSMVPMRTVTALTSNFDDFFNFPKNQKFRLVVSALTLGTATGFRISSPLDGLIYTPTVTATGSYDFFWVTNYAFGFQYRFIGTPSGATSVSFTIIPLGTLFEQDSGQRHAGYMVGDTSGNKLDLILPASGVSIIDPAQRGTIRFTTTTSGNQQIGGSQVIIPTNARISSWVINSSGTPNVTLGNVSAGAQYRASAAVVSGDNQITLLTPFTTTGNLWVNSSTTATLKHTIMWEYIQ